MAFEHAQGSIPTYIENNVARAVYQEAQNMMAPYNPGPDDVVLRQDHNLQEPNDLALVAEWTRGQEFPSADNLASPALLQHEPNFYEANNMAFEMQFQQGQVFNPAYNDVGQRVIAQAPVQIQQQPMVAPPDAQNSWHPTLLDRVRANNEVMTEQAFIGITSRSLRDAKSKANDKIMSAEMKENYIQELIDGSYTPTIADPKERAQMKHQINTKYIWVPFGATPQTFEGMSRLCHDVILTRKPGNLYSMDLSEKQCKGIKKRLAKSRGQGGAQRGEFEHPQAPVTTQEGAYSDFCIAHIGPKGHKGRDATYDTLNDGVSDSFSKSLVTALIAECFTCKKGFEKASAAGHKAERGRQLTRQEKKDGKKRAHSEFADFADQQQEPVKKSRKLKSTSTTKQSTLPQGGQLEDVLIPESQLFGENTPSSSASSSRRWPNTAMQRPKIPAFAYGNNSNLSMAPQDNNIDPRLPAPKIPAFAYGNNSNLSMAPQDNTIDPRLLVRNAPGLA